MFVRTYFYDGFYKTNKIKRKERNEKVIEKKNDGLIAESVINQHIIGNQNQKFDFCLEKDVSSDVKLSIQKTVDHHLLPNRKENTLLTIEGTRFTINKPKSVLYSIRYSSFTIHKRFVPIYCSRSSNFTIEKKEKTNILHPTNNISVFLTHKKPLIIAPFRTTNMEIRSVKKSPLLFVQKQNNLNINGNQRRNSIEQDSLIDNLSISNVSHRSSQSNTTSRNFYGSSLNSFSNTNINQTNLNESSLDLSFHNTNSTRATNRIGSQNNNNTSVFNSFLSNNNAPSINNNNDNNIRNQNIQNYFLVGNNNAARHLFGESSINSSTNELRSQTSTIGGSTKSVNSKYSDSYLDKLPKKNDGTLDMRFSVNKQFLYQLDEIDSRINRIMPSIAYKYLKPGVKKNY